MEETNQLIDKIKKPIRPFVYKAAVVAAVCVCVAAVVFFLDRNLPQVATEEGTEHELSEGSYLLYHTEELESALEDEAITEIIIPDGIHAILPSVALNKKMTIERSAVLEVGFLDIAESGYVNVEGTLDARDDMIRMNGDDTRLAVASGGTLYLNENTILWCDSDRNLFVSAGADCYGSNDAKNLLLDEEDTFGEAISVRTKEELTAALSGKKPVRIETDLTLDTATVFRCPVYVSEDAALRTTGGGSICVETELFVNFGTLEGCIFAGNGAFLLNLGSITANGMSADDAAVIYNGGSILAREWEQSDAVCFNYGTIDVETEEATEAASAVFTITNAGRLYNYGYVNTGENSSVINNGFIENACYFTVLNNASFENNVLCNRGQFESGLTSAIDEQSGIYYGNGEYRINGLSSVAVWKTADLKVEESGSEVTTEEELAAALLDNETEQIIVTGPIELTEDIEITKPVFLKAQLTAQQSAAILLKNTYMILLGGGSLSAKALHMENALFVCEEGSADFTGAEVVLDNRSSLCADSGDVIFADAQIELKKNSVLSMPFEKNALLSGSNVRLESSCFMINRAETSVDADIALEKESSLCIYSPDTVWDEHRIVLDEGSEICR